MVTSDISLPGDWIEIACRSPRVVTARSALKVCPSARTLIRLPAMRPVMAPPVARVV